MLQNATTCAYGRGSQRPAHAGSFSVARARCERVPATAVRVALAVELQRDWAREETVGEVIEIVLTERLLKA